MSWLQNGSWEMCCIGGEVMTFASTWNEKLWIPSKFIEIRFAHRVLVTGMRKKIEKTTRQVKYILVPLHGNNSETGWDMFNLVDYRVIMTYYWMKFMPWKCWSMHWQPVYGISVDLVHIGFHSLSCWRWLIAFTCHHFIWIR